MKMTQEFTPAVFGSYQSMQNWLYHPGHIENMEKGNSKRSPLLSIDNQINFLEIIVCLCECCIDRILAYGIQLCQDLGLRSLSLRIQLIYLHNKTSSLHLQALKTHRTSLLCFCKNLPHLSTADIYLHQPIPKKTIHDGKIIKLLQPYTGEEEIQFFHQTGTCRGMCYWFIHLYFKARDKFKSSSQLIRAISDQFKDGAPRPATLLQSICATEKILGLVGTTQTFYLKDFTLLKEALKKNPPGIYSIGLGKHRINYIKTSSEKAYIFDPNIGTVYFKKDQHGRSFDLMVKLAKEFAIEKDAPKVTMTHYNTKPEQKGMQWQQLH